MKAPVPWLRVFVEGVVIVGSILLALGLDEWRVGVQERAEEHEILLGLRIEFVDHRSQIVRIGDRWEAHSRGINQLLVAIESKALPSVEAMDTALFRFVWASTFDPGSGVRDALITSGKLDLIESPELRTHLSGWASVADELRDNEVAMRTFVLTTVFPYLARAGVPITRAMAAGGREYPPLAHMPDARAALVYQSLFEDPEFEALVSQRSGWYNTEEYRDAVPFVDRLLALIEEELAR